MAKGTYYLLSDGASVAKLKHGKEELGITNAGLYLAPADMVEGIQMCAAHSKGCRNACLFNSGLAERFHAINERRKKKTELWRDQPEAFLYLLVQDLELLEARSLIEKTYPAARLNCTSDVVWERHPVMRYGEKYDNVFEAFPDTQFYDYTKLPGRIASKEHGRLPENYHITFSLSEENDKTALKALDAGLNVAVAMFIKKGQPPETFSGFPVVDGDKHDFRFLDPAEGGHIVALSPKGFRGRHDESGFVKQPDYVIGA